jgi:hypothetical protein
MYVAVFNGLKRKEKFSANLSQEWFRPDSTRLLPLKTKHVS